MAVEALIVDLFGTLVPKWSWQMGDEVKQRIASIAAVRPEQFLQLWNSTRDDREVGQSTIEATLHLALRGCGANPQECRVDDLIAIWSDFSRSRLAPRNAAVTDTLRWCRESGLKIGLLSNAGPEMPALFAETVLADLMDARVFSAEVGVAKPHPLIYRTVCEQLAVEPSRCVFVGDGGDDELAGARRFGMNAVWLRVDEEIEREGLPPAGAKWDGAVITAFEAIRQHLGVL